MSRLTSLALALLASLPIACADAPAVTAGPAGAPSAGAEAPSAPCASGSACGAALGEGRVADAPVGDGPRLLEFEAAYCAACTTMAPVVTSLVRSCAKASEVVQRVDVAAEPGEALARRYRVQALPTFLAVDAEGHEVLRREGVQEPAALASLVAEVTGRDCSAAN